MADDYAWMRDVEDPALHTYLVAENAHTDRATAHLSALRRAVYDELSSVLPDEDRSAPWRRGRWVYFTRRRKGQQYAVHCRSPVENLDGTDATPAEQVILDENALAQGHSYLDLGVLESSPDGNLLAFSVDHDGDEVFTLQVRDLRSGELLPNRLTNTYYGLGWSAAGDSFLYTTLDDSFRPDRVWRHVLDTSQEEDEVVWHEPDRRFELTVESSRSGALLFLDARSRDTAETRVVLTDDLSSPPLVVAPRRPGVDYAVDHQGDRLLIVTDDTGPEFRLAQAPLAGEPAGWTEVLAHSARTRVESVDAFADHLVVTEREGGSVRLRILDSAGATVRLVTADAPWTTVRLGRNEDYAADAVRIVREGWTDPPTVLDHDLATGAETVVHRQEVRGEPPESYACTSVEVVAADGTEVPMTLVSRARPSGQDGARPCLLYGYGAYEASLDPEFWPELRPLLDRGFLIAVAHVRGGGERGRQWWLAGRLRSKRNTFTDFVSCARHLVDNGMTAPELLVARGISAGGLLMGAVLHLAPELFAAVVAEVPFVDVVGSMLDDTLPLTVNEWDEWGDPRDPDDYAYLRGYSPYENLPGPARPALLVTASRHDPRVSVHEPAKWVARMRSDGQGDAPLLLRTALGAAAHTGPAGRYDAWRHEAFLLAFVLDAVGLAQPPETASSASASS